MLIITGSSLFDQVFHLEIPYFEVIHSEINLLISITFIVRHDRKVSFYYYFSAINSRFYSLFLLYKSQFI